MRGMMKQIDIPAVSFEAAGKKRGFVTRSFVRDDEGDVCEREVVMSGKVYHDAATDAELPADYSEMLKNKDE